MLFTAPLVAVGLLSSILLPTSLGAPVLGVDLARRGREAWADPLTDSWASSYGQGWNDGSYGSDGYGYDPDKSTSAPTSSSVQSSTHPSATATSTSSSGGDASSSNGKSSSDGEDSSSSSSSDSSTSSSDSSTSSSDSSTSSSESSTSSSNDSSSSSDSSGSSPSGSSASSDDSADRSYVNAGRATWYTQGGVAGACGRWYSDSSYVVALDADRYAGGSNCFKKVTIRNRSNGATVSAIVADECPGCGGYNNLDLSTQTFKAIGSLSQGVLPIEWWYE